MIDEDGNEGVHQGIRHISSHTGTMGWFDSIFVYICILNQEKLTKSPFSFKAFKFDVFMSLSALP